MTLINFGSILYVERTYVNNKHDYFEVGNGSRRTLKRVPEMMDTPPIQNNYAFILFINSYLEDIWNLEIYIQKTEK